VQDLFDSGKPLEGDIAACMEKNGESEVGIEVLVIGNDAYHVKGMPGDGTLKNCVRDAVAVKEALEKLGARCRLLENVRSVSTLMKTVSKWAEERLRGSVRIAFIFWAGHALSHRGETHLVPTYSSEDPCYISELVVGMDTMALRSLIKLVRAANAECTIQMALDSCRNEVELKDATFGFTHGANAADAGNGRVDIIYSTAYGITADDNSPFKESLIECLGGSLVYGSLLEFWQDVTHKTKALSGGTQQPRLDLGSTKDVTLLPPPKQDAPDPAQSLSSPLPASPNFIFFSYIIVQPGVVLTWHIDYLTKHAALVKGMEHHLKSNFADWLKEHHPIFLTDENDLFDPSRTLSEGMSRSPVLCAKGRGWVPPPGFPHRRGELGPLLDAFAIKGWPEIIVVCQRYGPRTTAENLFSESGKKVTVVWFRVDVHPGCGAKPLQADKFCSFLKDVLGECAVKRPSETDTRCALATSASKHLGMSISDVSESNTFFGIFGGNQDCISEWKTVVTGRAQMTRPQNPHRELRDPRRMRLARTLLREPPGWKSLSLALPDASTQAAVRTTLRVAQGAARRRAATPRWEAWCLMR